MRSSAITTCLWPGLPRLWFSGEWTGLAVAVLFAIALNLVLAASFVWPGWMSWGLVALAWAALLTLWGAFTALQLWQFSALTEQNTPGYRGLFLQAQGEYLRGHWSEAESLLKKLLRSPQPDVDAHLMLATLYRRTNRLRQASQQLQKLESTGSRAEKWRYEIEVERRLVASLDEPSLEAKQIHTSS